MWMRTRRVVRNLLAAAGALALLFTVWITAGFPILIDRWLDVTEPPAPADAIVCIAGGTGLPNLPTAEGWERLYTAVQLFADGYAPVVVFTGRGSSAGMTEAEVYADAGGWLGVPREAILLDPRPTGTNEHPAALLLSTNGRLTKDSRLLLVTSRLHSRRVLMTFRKQGFTNVRVVSDYRASRATGRLARGALTSQFTELKPSGKAYGGMLMRADEQVGQLSVAIRETAALAWYWWKGLV
jgi:uncharacterized SAM-binding protein YcdF (DUF218 family)